MMVPLTRRDRRTPLHRRHDAAGAKLLAFAGWQMPLQYTGIRDEHLAVRRHAGVFDVSHMGQVETSGPGAQAFLQRVLSNDVSRMPEGGAQYSVLCREDGGVLDDLFTYRLATDRFLTVTNAANHGADLAWMRRHAGGFDVELRDRLADYAMLAVQGPRARHIVGALTQGELPARLRTALRPVAGVPEVRVCGTGYTGEDGVELLLAPDAAPAVWDAVVEHGAQPVGLGARDTLRLEACFPLYGNELMESRGPIEAGLGWCCKEETGFIGAEAVHAVREAGPRELLAPFLVTDGGIARPGNRVGGGGEVTSGTLSPSLGIGVGMAYLPTDRAVPGTSLDIDVRGRIRTAEVHTKPLYRKETHT
jgi:aminomethyltransferase